MFNITQQYERSDHRKKGMYFEKDGQTYQFEVYYNLGGMNYFTGKVDPRGYWVSVTPIQLSKAGDNGEFVIKTVTVFTGARVIVYPASRYASRTLMEVSDKYLNFENEMFAKLFSQAEVNRDA